MVKLGHPRNTVLQVHTLENRRLENFLERHKAYYAYTGEIEVDRFLREILQKANEFVPSEAGSILLDDPITKKDTELVPYKIVKGSNGDAWVQAGGKDYSPSQISAFILQKMKETAEAYLGETVTQAVITVPAYFNDAQRQATKDAGRIAGLEVLRLVNEPTAASLAYGLDRKQNGIVAVYDLGGGTFDISILKLHDGIFEVIATNGDTHLGGDDIDNLLITIALDDIRGDLNLDLRRNAEAVQAIRKSVIDAKIALSSQPSVKLDIELPGSNRYRREITREQFEQSIQENRAENLLNWINVYPGEMIYVATNFDLRVKGFLGKDRMPGS